MVKKVEIYVEGGGDGKEGKAKVRMGFAKFFHNATGKNFKVVACGGRDQAFDGFQNALKSNPSAFNILLVDSEAFVRDEDTPWQHLKKRDGWDKPNEVDDTNCHLMVQTMEAWLIADKEALAAYYGNDFNLGSLPKQANIELIAKRDIEQKLKLATGKTKPKGEYHKIKHAPEILGRLKPEIVCQASPHCARLIKILKQT